MRVLALDHGSARCGVAVSDPTGTIVTPLEVVERPDSKNGMAALHELVTEREIDLVLVGLPRLQSGDEGSQAGAARAFAGRLEAAVGVPVELYDERFTTRMAQASRAGGATSAEDSLAAAHLLDEYLEMKRNKGQA